MKVCGVCLGRRSLPPQTKNPVLSQSRVTVSTSLTNIGSLADGAFDLVDCSLSVVRFVSVFHVGR